MGRSCFLRVLLILALLALSFSHGFGRRFLMETAEVGDSYAQAEETKGNSRNIVSRNIIEVLDYQLDPVPNTNPSSGLINVPPPQGR